MSDASRSVLRVPAKDPQKRRATWNAWYARTKKTRRTPERVEHERVTKLARRFQNAKWLRELRASLVCNRCGENHPGCLVFHHRDPKQKEISVAVAVRRGWGRQRILREITKCEVLCVNCHMKHHAEELRRGR